MRIIGLMVVGAGEADRYLEASLKEFKRLCDDAVIVGNNTDPKTEKLIQDYGYWFYRDDREWGINQPKIKTDLLKRIGKLNPDVILPIDADEVYDSSFTRERVEEYSQKYPACYLYIVNLWNDEQHHRKSMGFWNIRMFNWRPELGLEYARKNVHCGLGPPWAYNFGSYIPHFVKHYGLMTQESRDRKVARYEKYDPNGKFKDMAYYNALKDKTDGSELNEQDMLNKLADEVHKMGDQQKTIMKNKDEKYVYVRRLSDGQVIDIPERHLAETLMRGFELMGDVSDPQANHKEILPPQAEPKFECPICGKEFKNQAGLTKHKKSHL